MASRYKTYGSGESGGGYRRFQAVKQIMDAKADEEERGMKKQKFEMDSKKFEADQAGAEFERSQKETKATQEKEEEEIMYRAMFGAPREKIAEELRNPMGPDTEAEDKFKKNPMTLSMMKSRAAMSARKPLAPARSGSGTDRSLAERESALLAIEGLDPAKTSRADAIRILVPMFKSQKWQSDPDLKAALKRFPESVVPVEPAKGPGIWDRFKRQTSEFFNGPEAQPSTVEERDQTLTNARKPAAPAPAASVETEDAPENPFADDYPDAVWDAEIGAWIVEREGKKFKVEE